jgi:DNA-binding transcriptional LysR family regulator
LLEKRGLQRKVRVTVEQEVAIFQLVCNSNLLANVAELAAREYAKFMPIKILPIPLEAIELQHFQYWHDRHHHDPGHRWLAQNGQRHRQRTLTLPFHGCLAPAGRSRPSSGFTF